MKYPIVVMTPYYGMWDPDHRACMAELDKKGISVLPLRDQPYLDIARSVLCCEAMRQAPKAKVLFFIDHDILFDAEDVIGMCERLLENDLDVTGAGYSMRRPGSITSIGPMTEGSIDFYVPGFKPARYVAMGFTAINVSVFKRLDEVMPELYCTSVRRDFRPYFERYVKDDTYYPDDIGFCFRVRDMGMKVWVDTQPRILHRGKYDYALEDACTIVPNVEKLTLDFGRGESVP